MNECYREDLDLKYVHKWFDNDKQKPSRDEAASFSPALRLYWLNFNLLEKRNGVLFQKHVLSKSSEISYQLLVPKILRKEIVKNWHDTFYAAHFGISKTLDGIKKDLHWYKMSEDVKFHVRCCAVCGRFRSLSGRPGAALREIPMYESQLLAFLLTKLPINFSNVPLNFSMIPLEQGLYEVILVFLTSKRLQISENRTFKIFPLIRMNL
jgi:hypothetical protein